MYILLLFNKHEAFWLELKSNSFGQKMNMGKKPPFKQVRNDIFMKMPKTKKE